MRFKSRSKALWLAALMLLATALLLERGQDVSPRHLRLPLRELSLALGAWRAAGPDGVLDAPTLGLLKPQDYLLRNYLDPYGRVYALFVAYFGLQQEGQIIHSPRHCLPGAGWHIESRNKINVRAGGKNWRVNHLIVNHELNRFSVLYWYQGRGRVEANEYLDRLYLLIDGLRYKRTDGALVRLTSLINPADPGTLDRQIKLAADLILAMNLVLPLPGPAENLARQKRSK
jgi:EpsI family protein